MITTRATTRVRIAIAAVCVAAIALSGCTQQGKSGGTGPAAAGGAGAATSAAPTPEPLKITAQALNTGPSLATANPTVSYAGMLHGMNGAGFLAGVRSDGNGMSEAAFWRSAGKEKWEETSVSGIPEGNVTALSLTGGMIAGTVVSPEGKPANFMLRSEDLKKWDKVEVPPEAGGYELTEIAWGNDNAAYVLGVDGQQRAMLVTWTPSGVTAQPLPEPEPGHYRAYRTLAAHGKTVVAGYYDGPRDGQAASLAFVSADGGATWDSVTVSKDLRSEYTGSTWLDEFVISGMASSGGETSDMVPAMWTSKDGKTWKKTKTPKVTKEDVSGPDRGTSGTSFAGDTLGSFLAAVRADNAPGVSVFLRPQNTGVWEKQGPTLTADSIAPFAVPFQLERGDGLLTSGNGEIAIWRCTDSENWDKVFSAGKTSEAPSADRAYSAKGYVAATGSQKQFRVDDDGGWQRSTHTVAMEAKGAMLSDASWQGVDLKDSDYAVMGSDEATGTQVLAARSATDANSLVIQTWVRAGGTGAWVKGGTVKAQGAAAPRAVAWDGKRWVIALGESPATDSWRFAFATSPDGKKWTTLPVKAPESYATLPNDMCLLPGGKLLAVGQQRSGPTGTYRPEAWIVAGESATQVPEAAVKDLGASIFNSCASGPDGVLISGGDGESLYLTKDGATFEKAATFDPASAVKSISAVPGGYALGGRIEKDGEVGPAIWLSRDAKNWQPQVLPGAFDTNALAVVASDGTDLVAITTGSRPAQAWRVADTATLLK